MGSVSSASPASSKPSPARRVHRLSQSHLLFVLRGCQCGHLRCLPCPLFVSSRCVAHHHITHHIVCVRAFAYACVAHITTHHHIACHTITSRTLLRFISVCVHTHSYVLVFMCERARACASASTHIYVTYAQVHANARTHLDIHAYTLLITHTHSHTSTHIIDDACRACCMSIHMYIYMYACT
jgi:hypothetical protein